MAPLTEPRGRPRAFRSLRATTPRCGGSFASAIHAPVESKPVTNRGVQSAAGPADASNAYTASRQEASYISMACVLPLGELVAIAVA